MRKLFLFIAISLTLLTGCNKDLGFIIEYDDADGLKKGDAIVHGDNIVGEIEDIQYTDSGKIQVEVSIKEAYRSLAQHSSLFYVGDIESTADKVIEVVTGSSDKAAPIEDGQVIKGADKMGGIAQKFSNQFGQAVQKFSKSMQSSWQEWKNETLDEQIDYLDAELDKIIVKAKDLNERTRKYLKEEIMPEINRKMEDLRKQLEQQDREEELDGIETKLNKVEKYLEA